jgi:hypothetical protein
MPMTAPISTILPNVLLQILAMVETIHAHHKPPLRLPDGTLSDGVARGVAFAGGITGIAGLVAGAGVAGADACGTRNVGVGAGLRVDTGAGWCVTGLAGVFGVDILNGTCICTVGWFGALAGRLRRPTL